jgi:hypothetical protein
MGFEWGLSDYGVFGLFSGLFVWLGDREILTVFWVPFKSFGSVH